jgi:hypothetical protein
MKSILIILTLTSLIFACKKKETNKTSNTSSTGTSTVTIPPPPTPTTTTFNNTTVMVKTTSGVSGAVKVKWSYPNTTENSYFVSSGSPMSDTKAMNNNTMDTIAINCLITGQYTVTVNNTNGSRLNSVNTSSQIFKVKL